MKNVKVEKKGTVVFVSLNRPDARNAFHPAMIDELTTLFENELNKDMKLRAVVLKGEGSSFCSGADLGWMQSMVNYTLEENKQDSSKLYSMFAALRACPVPLIGRVHGHVMGGALGLLAVCDIAAAESGTKFCFSEVKLGLAPAVISPFVLEKTSSSFAYRYMLTGDVFGAAEAASAGLVHFTGTIEAVDAYIETTLKSVRNNGPEAVRATKALLRLQTTARDWEKLKGETGRVIAERRVSGEGQEGLRGFLEKRDPSWKGN